MPFHADGVSMSDVVQMLISANGHHKVPFPDLIVAGKVGWKVCLPGSPTTDFLFARAWPHIPT